MKIENKKTKDIENDLERRAKNEKFKFKRYWKRWKNVAKNKGETFEKSKINGEKNEL